MNSPENDEEFYGLIGKNIIDITYSGIPEDEKEKLYFLFDETIARYEESKGWDAGKNLGEFSNGLTKIADSFGEIISNVGKIVEELPKIKENLKRTKESLNQTNKIIPKIKRNIGNLVAREISRQNPRLNN